MSQVATVPILHFELKPNDHSVFIIKKNVLKTKKIMQSKIINY